MTKSILAWETHATFSVLALLKHVSFCIFSWCNYIIAVSLLFAKFTANLKRVQLPFLTSLDSWPHLTVVRFHSFVGNGAGGCLLGLSLADTSILKCEAPTCQDSKHCIFVSGFTGKNCDSNIDDCPGHECQNGGTCVDGVNTYNCQCNPEFTGLECSFLQRKNTPPNKRTCYLRI